MLVWLEETALMLLLAYKAQRMMAETIACTAMRNVNSSDSFNAKQTKGWVLTIPERGTFECTSIVCAYIAREHERGLQFQDFLPQSSQTIILHYTYTDG